MDLNTTVIITGLIATLIAYAAVQDSEDGWDGTVGPMTWNISQSWASTTAAVIAIIFLLGAGDSSQNLIFVFGALLLFSPLIYRGLTGEGGASKLVFFVAATLNTWATFGLLVVAAINVPDLIASTSIVPRLVLNGAMILAIVAAFMNASRGLTAAASSSEPGAWILP